MNLPWQYLDTFQKGVPIAWDRMAGLWRQALGQLVTRAGRLVRWQRCMAAGDRLQCVGLIQRRYGVARDEARSLLAACERHALDPWYTAGGTRFPALAPTLPAGANPAKPPSHRPGLETK